MSRCDLEVVLEDPDRAYHPGETVSGEVHVSVNAKCDCRKLTVTRLWQTHGKGNRTEGDKEEVQLHAGTWMPGSKQAYPFSFLVPDGPLTYHGHHLNVDWYIKARADVPWAIDPKAETEFLLEPGENRSGISLGPKHDEENPGPEFAPEKIKQTVGKVAGVIFVACASIAVLAALGLAGIKPLGWAPGFGFGIFGLFGAIASGAMAFMGLRNMMAERVLGEVRARCEPAEVRAGDAVRCSLDFMPRKAVDLGNVTATLLGQEVVVSGSGTNRTTHRHKFHEEEILLAAGRSIRQIIRFE